MSKVSVVAIVRCLSYDGPELAKAVTYGMELLGGPASIFNGGRRLLLKPNMLLGISPENGATTHPAVFAAVAEFFQKNGYSLSYGDNPGFGRTETVSKKCGIGAQAKRLGIPLAEFEKGKEVKFGGGVQNKLFYIAQGVLDSENLVNLPKMKTHSLTTMTGALKNMFGVIPGLRKAAFHARLADPKAFARMIIDLNRFITPVLTIMDAVYGMEGNGPTHGDPVHTGLLLFSTDPVAVDATACRIMGIDPQEIFFLTHAEKTGLGNIRESRISIRGMALADCKGKPYKLSPSFVWDHRFPFLQSLGKKFLIPRPVINKHTCTACGVCIKICPVRPKALAAGKKGIPAYNYDHCIRCYCCQEMCPTGAVSVKVPPLGTLFYGFWGRS